jgi:hypothetical protein
MPTSKTKEGITDPMTVPKTKIGDPTKKEYKNIAHKSPLTFM